jgi:putative transposase
VLLGMKVKIYPTAKQAELIDTNIDVARYVFNYSLGHKKELWENSKEKVSKFDMINHISSLKKLEEYDFLNNGYAQSIQASIGDLDNAFKNFFRGNGYPKFKSRFFYKQSVTYPSGIKILGSKVKIPKIGAVRVRGLRNNLNIIKTKSGTITRESGIYYLSILCEVQDPKPITNNNQVGIDVGVAVFAYTSDNKQYKIDLLPKIEKQIKAQKVFSRKKRNSKNSKKAKSRLNKKYKKITNKRQDFIHKVTHELSKNKLVAVEDLKIKNMSKSARGTKENPKQSSGKRGLNRVILQQGWGMFFTILEYKLLMNKGQLIKVNPAHTSQQCTSCGHVSKDNRKSQDRFECIKCGFVANADYNASINILRRGIADSLL